MHPGIRKATEARAPRPTSSCSAQRALETLCALMAALGLSLPAQAANPFPACWYWLTRPILGQVLSPRRSVAAHHRHAWRLGFARQDGAVADIRKILTRPMGPLLPRTADHALAVGALRGRFGGLYATYSALVQWQLDEGLISVPTAERGAAAWAPFDNDVSRAIYFAPSPKPRHVILIGVSYQKEDADSLVGFIHEFSWRPWLAAQVREAAVFLPMPDRISAASGPALIFIAEMSVP